MDKIGGNKFLDPKYIFSQIGLTPGQRVADLGCGAMGHFVFSAAEAVGSGGQVYAVDIRQIVLVGIKNRARIDGVDNIETIWANLETFKSSGIATESLDLVMLFNTLFQNKKREEILKEAVRITKPGGHLAIIDWQPQETLFGPPLEMRVDPDKVKKFCQSNGLQLEREFIAGNFHFGLLFKK